MPKRPLSSSAPRQLGDLDGVGAASLGDFAFLGITSVPQLATCDAPTLYASLNSRYHADRARGLYAGFGADLDLCVLDVLHCAIAQARDAELPAEQRKWWWWSRQRKQEGGVEGGAVRAKRAKSGARSAAQSGSDSVGMMSTASSSKAAPMIKKKSSNAAPTAAAAAAPRTSPSLPDGVVHELPVDLRKALSASAASAEAWARVITPLGRNEFICWVSDAKRAETREKRIARAVEALQEGKRRPCCWPGCKHR